MVNHSKIFKKMKIHYSIDSIKTSSLYNLEQDSNNKGVIVTIGIFDGVHTGHVALLNRTIELSKLFQKESVVLTFSPHPRVALNQEPEKLKILTSQNEKIKLLTRLNIDNILILPFTHEIADLTAEKFIEYILVNKLNISHLVVGYNHRFGNGGITFNELEKLSQKFNFQLEKFPAVDINKQIPSSSQIRDLLIKGDIKSANKLLGYNYIIEGKVVEGKKIGRTISFPTANILVSEQLKLIPPNGVYACYVNVRGNIYKGMTNIGHLPTINKNNPYRSIEVHILDFNKNIYNEDIEIHLVEKIRDEIKFPNIEELKKQIIKDINNLPPVLS